MTKTKQEITDIIYSDGTARANRDIFILDVIKKKFAGLGMVLSNEQLESNFKILDDKAISYKFWFNWIGFISLCIIITVLLINVWKLIGQAGNVEQLTFSLKTFWFSIIVAGLGFIASFIPFLLLAKIHKKWIYYRYQVEKIRQWKFQQMLDGEFVEEVKSKITTEAGQQEIRQKYTDRLTLFASRFAHGEGDVQTFIKTDSLELDVKPSAYTDEDLFDSVLDVYQEVRLNVQISHFRDKDGVLETKDRWTDGLAKAFLLAGVILAVLEIGLLAFDIESIYLFGAALSFTILSVGVRVYRSATAIAEERDRYNSKASALELIKVRINMERASSKDKDKLLKYMEDAELVCIQELREWIRSFRRAEYYL